MIDTINDKIAKAVDEKQFDAAIEEIAKKAVDEYISRAGEEIGRGKCDLQCCCQTKNILQIC